MSTNKTIPVSEIMLKPDSFPVLHVKSLFKEALEAMDRSRLGIACIVDEEQRLLAIVTDGDIRRQLLKVQKPFSAFFADDALKHAVHKPITIHPTTPLVESVTIMGDKQIWDLPVVDDEGVLVGLVHLHPAIKAVLAASSQDSAQAE